MNYAQFFYGNTVPLSFDYFQQFTSNPIFTLGVESEEEDRGNIPYAYNSEAYKRSLTTSNYSYTSDTHPVSESDDEKITIKFTPGEIGHYSSYQILHDNKIRRKYCTEYLIKNAGLSKEAAAGLVGVLFAESGLKPLNVNIEERSVYSGGSYGKGLAQWSNERRLPYDEYIKRIEIPDYYTSEDKKLIFLNAELEYIIKDMQTNRPKMFAALTSAKSPEDAATIVHTWYENGSANAPASPEQMNKTYKPAWDNLRKTHPDYPHYDFNEQNLKRLNYAKEIYNWIS